MSKQAFWLLVYAEFIDINLSLADRLSLSPSRSFKTSSASNAFSVHPLLAALERPDELVSFTEFLSRLVDWGQITQTCYLTLSWLLFLPVATTNSGQVLCCACGRDITSQKDFFFL